MLAFPGGKRKTHVSQPHGKNVYFDAMCGKYLIDARSSHLFFDSEDAEIFVSPPNLANCKTCLFRLRDQLQPTTRQYAIVGSFERSEAMSVVAFDFLKWNATRVQEWERLSGSHQAGD
jgi:hypothetical protein